MNNTSARFVSFLFFLATTASPSNALADGKDARHAVSTTTVTNAAAPKPAGNTKAAVAPAKVATTRVPVAGEIAELARGALATSGAKLPKGATITNARPTTETTIPIAPSRVTMELTALPSKRVGKMTTTAVLVFWKDADVAARFPVTLEIAVPAEALVADVPKGAPVMLIVQRGSVEVSAPAVTSADGDVGDVVQVLLKPSGRAMRAQLVAKDRAIATEDGR